MDIFIFIIRILITLLTPTIIAFIVLASYKKTFNHIEKSHFVIKISKKYALIFIFTSIIIAILLALTIQCLQNSTNKIIICIILSGIEIILLACLLFTRQKVVVDENEITYTPSIGKTQAYDFREITCIKEKTMFNGILKCYQIYIGNKEIFEILNTQAYYKLFIDKAIETGIDIIPEKETNRNDTKQNED